MTFVFIGVTPFSCNLQYYHLKFLEKVKGHRVFSIGKIREPWGWFFFSLVPPAGDRLLGEGAGSALALTED
jgi:hypothetical protein